MSSQFSAFNLTYHTEIDAGFGITSYFHFSFYNADISTPHYRAEDLSPSKEKQHGFFNIPGLVYMTRK